MKILSFACAVFFSFSVAAQTTYPATNSCVDGHVDTFKQSLLSFIQQHILAFGKTKGIAFDQASLQNITLGLALSESEISTSIDGNFKSADGTVFRVYFAYEIDDSTGSDPYYEQNQFDYDAKLTSNGSDKEGNPIPPLHCTMKLDNEVPTVDENGRQVGTEPMPTFLVIENVKWKKRIGTIGLPLSWKVF